VKDTKECTPTFVTNRKVIIYPIPKSVPLFNNSITEKKKPKKQEAIKKFLMTFSNGLFLTSFRFLFGSFLFYHVTCSRCLFISVFSNFPYLLIIAFPLPFRFEISPVFSPGALLTILFSFFPRHSERFSCYVFYPAWSMT